MSTIATHTSSRQMIRPGISPAMMRLKIEGMVASGRLVKGVNGVNGVNGCSS